jgi:hypothetical protein
VLDTQTCLLWQREFQKGNPTFAVQDANGICQKLGAGWRLPTLTELLSIVDSSKKNPAVNSVFKTPNTGEWFSTSTGSRGFPFYVSFWDGGAYRMCDSLGVCINTPSFGYYIRCVWGDGARDESRNAPDGRYINGEGIREGTVFDTVTRLTWEKNVRYETLDFQSASDYCAEQNNISLGGYSSKWRLPSISELRSIVARNKSMDVIDDVFGNIPSNMYFYWTSSLVTGSNPPGYWTVDFSSGDDGIYSASNKYGHVRCVH